MILYIITIFSLIFGSISISLMLKYLYLYRNLHTNFKSFLNFVDENYIRKDNVIIHNALVEALQRARQNKYDFEEKAYAQLLQSLKNK